MTTQDAATRKYDLLLKGGRVIDPANNIDGLFDVATSGGSIALVGKDISPALARTVADVSGLVVTPGLVDLHAHFYGYDEGGGFRAVDAHVELADITFIATRNLRPVFKTKVSVKIREAESERRGDQYAHAIEAMRLAFNDLVKKSSKARIPNR